MKKKGAIEMSISTIVIIVLAMTMLILGFVLIRTIFCKAIGLTGDINTKVEGEINKLFGSTGGEVVCIGSSGEAVKMVPGKDNIVFCAVKAPITAKYLISVTDISSRDVSSSELNKWLGTDDSWTGTIGPGDEVAKKVARLKIPDNAPETGVVIQVTIKKEGEVISTQDLDFQISRQGFIRAAMC